MTQLPENNLDYPVFIEIGGSFGSGFILKHLNGVYLVTAAHVLYRGPTLIANTAKVTGHAQRFAHRFELEIDLFSLEPEGLVRKHAAADVCIVKIADPQLAQGTVTLDPRVTVLQHLPAGVSIVGISHESLHNFADVGISNDAFVFGYPLSIGHPGQLEPAKPLIRKGLVAGLNEANKTIIVDAPVYGGNSGGLVIEAIVTGIGAMAFRGIGVVTQFIPFFERVQSLHFPGIINTNVENSGYSVIEPMDKILELV